MLFYTLFEWIKSIGDAVKRRIRRLKHSVNTKSESMFRDPDAVHELSRMHENFVIVPTDKALYLCLQETHPDRGTYDEMNSIQFLGTLHTIRQIFLHQ